MTLSRKDGVFVAFRVKKTAFREGFARYKVGFDLPAGEYRATVEPGERGYYCIYSSSDVMSGRYGGRDIHDNDLFDSTAYFIVENGQYLEINRATIELV